MSLGDFLCYIEDLKAGTNTYRQLSYHKRQHTIAKQKFRNMCNMVTLSLSKGYYTRDEILCLLGGYSCYVLPSTLLSNSARFFLPMEQQEFSVLERYRELLLPYYPTIGEAVYTPLAEPMYFEDYPSVTLRNCFTLPDGKQVVMEHIGKDVGGYLRGFYLCQLFHVMPQLDIHLICICEQDEDMIRFCKHTGYSVKYPIFSYQAPFYVTFLMEDEFSEPDALLKNITDLEEPVPVYIRTAKQNADMLSYAATRKEMATSSSNNTAPNGDTVLNMSLADVFANN